MRPTNSFTACKCESAARLNAKSKVRHGACKSEQHVLRSASHNSLSFPCDEDKMFGFTRSSRFWKQFTMNLTHGKGLFCFKVY